MDDELVEGFTGVYVGSNGYGLKGVDNEEIAVIGSVVNGEDESVSERVYTVEPRSPAYQSIIGIDGEVADIDVGQIEEEERAGVVDLPRRVRR